MTTTLPSGTTLHRAADRGVSDFGWLTSRHSFSFGRFQDPRRVGVRSLRVLNDDIVDPGAGFTEHGHDNMEIISWVLEGALEHRDSTGTRGVIRPGDVQVMSAGRGIRHSEMNASRTEPVHFLQIWIEPDERNTPPAYADRTFDAAGRRNRWQTIVGGDGAPIRQDVTISVADMEAGQQLSQRVAAGRTGYLHVVDGHIRVDGVELSTGDALERSTADDLTIDAASASQVLFFDLA